MNMEMMHTLKFRLAESQDIPALLQLINTAYREKHVKSWTNEAEILSGERIQTEQLEALIARQYGNKADVQFLVAELNQQVTSEIMGCVAVTYVDNDAEIGTFCIASHRQGQGYGQQVLHAAVLYAQKHEPLLKTFSMWVLDVRKELIAFYERRGYQQTGSKEDFPLDANVGTPLVDLHLIQLQKCADELR